MNSAGRPTGAGPSGSSAMARSGSNPLVLSPRKQTPAFLDAILVLGRLPGRFVVENDQPVDRDAELAVDQERIDVDRGDSAAGVGHQIGQADQRLHGGGLMQRGLASIAAQLDSRLGAADQ